MKKLKFRASVLLFTVVALGSMSARAQVQASHSSTGQSQPGEDSQESSARIESSRLLAQARPARRPWFSLMPLSASEGASGPAFSLAVSAGIPNPPVQGVGTLGRLTRWIGFGSGDSVIGDSVIAEDKFGKIGVGTDTPTSKLTVAGMIESTNGGIKFPDGTIQTTSGIGSVLHDGTLTGNGTSGSLLGIADGAIGTAKLATAAVTSAKIAPGQVVKSLNGLTDDLTLVAGRNITITQSAGTVSIAASGAEEPGRSPYQETKAFTFGAGGCEPRSCEIFFSPVPEGKRLVLKSISVELIVYRGIQAQVVLDPRNLVSIFVPTFLQGNFGQDFILANLPLQAYSDPGVAPVVFFGLSANTLSAVGAQGVTLTGYYVDVP